ncbi:MAG: UvrD-helicase domain-containing protein [Faecalibacterium prausnitzii]
MNTLPCGCWRTPEGKPTPLCENIRQDYAAVMVDEYQDTNALQDALYRCLAAPAGDNLFLVGDLKQSIYRFRQAEPGIFRQKLDSWAAAAGRHKPVPARRRAPRARTPAGAGCKLPLRTAGGGGHQLSL